MPYYQYDSIVDALTGLRQRGYEYDFNLKPHCIECESLQLQLRPEEFEIDEAYRFEGASNPDDNSVIYAISALDRSVKGVLVDAYGVYASAVTTEMAEKLNR